jgi:hypothetical protein
VYVCPCFKNILSTVFVAVDIFSHVSSFILFVF